MAVAVLLGKPQRILHLRAAQVAQALLVLSTVLRCTGLAAVAAGPIPVVLAVATAVLAEAAVAVVILVLRVQAAAQHLTPVVTASAILPRGLYRMAVLAVLTLVAVAVVQDTTYLPAGVLPVMAVPAL